MNSFFLKRIEANLIKQRRKESKCETNLKQICKWRANLSLQIIYEIIEKSEIGQFDGINQSKMIE